MSHELKAHTPMTFEPNDMLFVYVSVAYMEDMLRQHATWLRDQRGVPLPGTETAIEEVEKELKQVRDLQLRIYENSFKPRGV